MIGLEKILQNKFGKIIILLYLCLTLKQKDMEYKVLTSSSPEGLTEKINNLIKNGWKPMGSHQVVEQHRQNRYSGLQHQDTLIKHEYSISMVKEFKPNVIEVDIAFYHPNDDETIKVYDEEGMLQEFYYKLDCIIKNAGL
jgi:hypothetical protein